MRTLKHTEITHVSGGDLHLRETFGNGGWYAGAILAMLPAAIMTAFANDSGRMGSHQTGSLFEGMISVAGAIGYSAGFAIGYGLDSLIGMDNAAAQ